MNLENQLFMVTGGASGLGRSVVDALIQRRAFVVALDLNESELNALQQAHPQQVLAVVCDVCDEGSILSAIDQAKSWKGQIRGLVNCAGIIGAGKLVGRSGAYALDAFKKVIDINLTGTVNTMRLVAADMASNEPTDDEERGVIINTASIAAYDGQKGQIAYAASKGGIVSMTLPAARDLASLGIRVNTIAPGIMATPMLMNADEKVLAPLLAVTQFPKRLGKPSEFADAVCFAMTNTLLNGETMRLDGAIRMP